MNSTSTPRQAFVVFLTALFMLIGLIVQAQDKSIVRSNKGDAGRIVRVKNTIEPSQAGPLSTPAKKSETANRVISTPPDQLGKTSGSKVASPDKSKHVAVKKTQTFASKSAITGKPGSAEVGKKTKSPTALRPGLAPVNNELKGTGNTKSYGDPNAGRRKPAHYDDSKTNLKTKN